MSEAVAALLGLEKQLRQATDPAQLYYTIVNQLDRCVPYKHAVLLVGERLESADVMAVSDVPTVDYTSPFVLFIESLAAHIARNKEADKVQVLTHSGLPEALSSEWRSLELPGFILWQPLIVEARNGALTGALMLFDEQAWSEEKLGVSTHLSSSIGHALFALRHRRPMKGLWQRLRQRKVYYSLIALLVLGLALPVRLSTLAPVEVIADSPRIVTAPLDGVVTSVDVAPNQLISPGDTLARMESTDLASEASVARQALAVAHAKLMTAQQGGFLDTSQKARLAELEAEVGLKESEWRYAEARLERSIIRAEAPGIAVLENPDEWKGRPVNTGERILKVADPNRVEFEISLPVKDSIALNNGAEVRVFLDSDPLYAWQAKLVETGYEPRQSADQQMVYRLVAAVTTLEETDGDFPRIGLRGTAKIYGERVSIFFYLFRRPITAVRQWLGW